jgi:hypothetical protein
MRTGLAVLSDALKVRAHVLQTPAERGEWRAAARGCVAFHTLHPRRLTRNEWYTV